MDSSSASSESLSFGLSVQWVQLFIGILRSHADSKEATSAIGQRNLCPDDAQFAGANQVWPRGGTSIGWASVASVCLWHLREGWWVSVGFGWLCGTERAGDCSHYGASGRSRWVTSPKPETDFCEGGLRRSCDRCYPYRTNLLRAEYSCPFASPEVWWSSFWCAHALYRWSPSIWARNCRVARRMVRSFRACCDRYARIRFTRGYHQSFFAGGQRSANSTSVCGGAPSTSRCYLRQDLDPEQGRRCAAASGQCRPVYASGWRPQPYPCRKSEDWLDRPREIAAPDERCLSRSSNQRSRMGQARRATRIRRVSFARWRPAGWCHGDVFEKTIVFLNAQNTRIDCCAYCTRRWA